MVSKCFPCNWASHSPKINFIILSFLALNRFQIWRPLTALFFYPTSFHYLINLYFLYSYSMRLETGIFAGRPADYAFMLFFRQVSDVLDWDCKIGLHIEYLVCLIFWKLSLMFQLGVQLCSSPCVRVRGVDGPHGSSRPLPVVHVKQRNHCLILVWHAVQGKTIILTKYL